MFSYLGFVRLYKLVRGICLNVEGSIHLEFAAVESVQWFVGSPGQRPHAPGCDTGRLFRRGFMSGVC